MLQRLQQWTEQFCQTQPQNFVPDLAGMQIFDPPLLGIAHAADPLFEELKLDSAVGPRHLSPREWLDEGVSVISYFLPFTEAVRKANRVNGLPALEWLYGRIEGEQFNKSLRQFLSTQLAAEGYTTLIPVDDPRFQVIDRRSNWSERHVAFVAGLGTVSLSASIITERGSAGRLSSLITTLELPATQRTYQKIDEHCSHCGMCIKRCPPLAINRTGKDHAVCGPFLDRVLQLFQPRYGCGKCQTAVPCEASIPRQVQSTAQS